MATTKDRDLSRQLGTLFNLGAIRELTDGQLLERFARGDGEAAELAFAALVERHGAMVMRVCRAQLNDAHDAQDAFQATFLVLVEKAGGLWVRDSLGPWLHQVALRTASCARSAALRRKRIEHRAAEDSATRVLEPGEDPEVARILHEEIGRLPERYRVPIVLCDLEGRSCEEAARALGRPVGTIKSWRARGRERLRSRLIRAGVAPTAAAGAVLVPEAARAAVVVPIAEQAVRILSAGMTAGTVPGSVSRLVKGVMKAMFLSQLRKTAAAACLLTGLGAGLAAAVPAGGDEPKRAADHPAPAKSLRAFTEEPLPMIPRPETLDGEAWPMTLPEAIRIGLDNSEAIRVIAFGAQGIPIGGYGPSPHSETLDEAKIVIAPKSPAADPEGFRSEVMGQVRRIENAYWFLAEAHAQLWASEKAAATAREILDREQSELLVGRGTVADVAEAAQRYEQFKLDQATRTTDVSTTERHFRRRLGLPPADNRRIIPITPPRESRVNPDLKQSLRVMFAHQPEIARAKRLITEGQGRRADDLDQAVAGLLPELDDTGDGPASLGEAWRQLDQFGPEGPLLRQAIEQAKASVNQSIREIDQKYGQFEKATRLRNAAAQRLDAQRAYYEEGRVTIDRFLDAVSQYYSAVATEARYKADYNVALVSLDMDRGSLLGRARIEVAEGPQPRKAYVQARDIQNARRPSQIRPDGPGRPARAATSPTPTDDASGTTYSFQLSIGSGPRPFEIKGSFTVTPAREGR